MRQAYDTDERASRPPALNAVAFHDRLEPISADAPVTGGTLHYAMLGEGPAILFCHGIPLSMTTWQDLFFALSRNYTVIAIDLPGYGRSSKDFHDYSLDAISHRIAELCAYLKIGRIHAIGSSFGAAVAATLALTEPTLIDRLVLFNSVGIAGGTHAVERAARSGLVGSAIRSALLRDGLGRAIFRSKLRMSYASLKPDEALIDHYYGLLLRDGGAHSFLQTLRQFKEPDLQRRLPELTHPVLSLWGTGDRVLPVRKSVAIQTLLPNCWATIVTGSGHLPHEERPYHCARLIHQFLRMPID